ncbi:PAS domain-containing protein [Patescibacteria group bacterium]|nr:PAS domain-containing protein [Patescibacteria group bacterium]
MWGRTKSKTQQTDNDQGDKTISDQRYYTIFDNVADGLIGISKSGRITEINKSLEKMTGHSKKDFVGKRITALRSVLTTESYLKIAKIFTKRMAGEKLDLYEIQIKKKDGSLVDVEINAKPIKENGQVVGEIVSIRNITERKEMQTALTKSKNRFRDISLNVADWIWEVDKDGKYVFVSGKYKEILGYDKEEIIGKTPFDFMPPEEQERVGKIFEEISSKKEPIKNLKNWNISKQGERIYLDTNGFPIINDKGELTGYRGVDINITGQKQAEQELDTAFKELKKRNEQLEIINESMVGRELKMVELKIKIKKLENDLEAKN